jgi:hypothetical protein
MTERAMHAVNATRRRLLHASIALPAASLLQSCTTPLAPVSEPNSAAARALLRKSAAAHGVDALADITDINVSYGGRWRPVVDKLQPALVDAGHRGRSEERILLGQNFVAQAFTGPKGTKHVTRRCVPGGEGELHVWFDGEESLDGDARAAAALVVDGYHLFLFGPMLLTTQWGEDRRLQMDLGPVARVQHRHKEYECDVLRVRMTPGLGFAAVEDLALYIDRDDHLMRRVRFSLNGLQSTRGAIAEVDAFEHVTVHGVRWPTRFHEQLLRPLPLPVHDWTLTGLDFNRGINLAEVSGKEFTGKALAPASGVGDSGA